MRQFFDDALTAGLCTLCVAAGLFYLFRSRSVEHLSAIEPTGRNRLRGRLRRANAVVMLVLAASFFWMNWSLNDKAIHQARAALLVVGLSLLVMLTLVAVDLYLTYRLRRDKRPPGA